MALKAAAAAAAAASMVPGSAFNFGPTPPGLGIGPAGLYSDNTTYLDEFRGAPTSYYLPPPQPTNHRNTPDTPGTDKTNNSTVPPPPPPTSTATYHQFLSHPSSRSSYPFMNNQMDPSSQIYQQYFRQDEFRTARMILNQGLLNHNAAAAAAGYGQPTGYHPLSMHKPYDAMNMNRAPWFP